MRLLDSFKRWLTGRLAQQAIRHRRARQKLQQETLCPTDLSAELTETPNKTSVTDQANAQKLRELANMAQQGRLAEAEIELHRWRRQPGCPVSVAMLLAAIVAKRGRELFAIQLLREIQPPTEPHLAIRWRQMLIALLVRTGQDDEAREHTNALHHERGHNKAVRQWLQAMDAPGLLELTQASDGEVARIARDLRKSPSLIRSLVKAQKLCTDSRDLHVLRQAIERVSRNVPEQVTQRQCCLAMAELALLAHDHDDARRWAHRGLRLNPYAAELALLLSRIDDDEDVGPRASAVLARAANAHPDYPDVLAALIRREHAEGRKQVAQRRLNTWLSRQPDQPIALKLAQELAEEPDWEQAA